MSLAIGRLARSGAWSAGTAALVLLGACTERRGSQATGEEFTHDPLAPVTLTGELFSAATSIGQPALMQVSGRILWITDALRDPGLHAIRLDGERILSVGAQGEGPGEFKGGAFSLFTDPGDDSGAIWAYDPSSRRLTRFDPSNSAEPRMITLKSPVRVHRVAWAEPDRLLGQAYAEGWRFVLFSLDGEVEEMVPGPLYGPEEAPVHRRLSATNSGIQVCGWPGRGFAVVNFGFGNIDYFDLGGHFVRNPDVPFPSEPTFELVEGELTYRMYRRWYVDCAVFGDQLYALFSGRDRSAFEGPERNLGRFVHVFDWDGSLDRVFELDPGVHALAATEEFLFGGSRADARIYRYRISK